MDFEITNDTKPDEGYFYYFILEGDIWLLSENKWINLQDGSTKKALDKNGEFNDFFSCGLRLKLSKGAYRPLLQLSLLCDSISLPF